MDGENFSEMNSGASETLEFDTQPTMMLISGSLVVCAMAMLIVRWRVVRGTTLVGPWSWLLASLIAIAAGEYITVHGGWCGYANEARLAASALTLCPAISLLGAKRPQDKAWHFIVASLWLVMALPALQKIVMAKSGELQLHAAQSWFLAILLVTGVLNSLFGRYGICVLMAGFGQTILMSPYLPSAVAALRGWDVAWGVSSFALSIILAAALFRGRRNHKPSSDSPSDSLWRDFRDAFGLAWTLRVAERLNAASRANGWNIGVGWSEFHSLDGTPLGNVSPEQMRAFRQTLHNLLRRFVNEAWIARRRGDLS